MQYFSSIYFTTLGGKTLWFLSTPCFSRYVLSLFSHRASVFLFTPAFRAISDLLIALIFSFVYCPGYYPALFFFVFQAAFLSRSQTVRRPVCSFPRIVCGFILCLLARHLMPVLPILLYEPLLIHSFGRCFDMPLSVRTPLYDLLAVVHSEVVAILPQRSS